MHERFPIQRYVGSERVSLEDDIAVEEPLEIRLGYDEVLTRKQRSFSITMRTPGHDEDLAVGFLFTEGVLTEPSQVREVVRCGKGDIKNVVRVELEPGVAPPSRSLDRNFYTTSSCGVCGKTSLDALEVRSPFAPAASARVSISILTDLPKRLEQHQAVFRRTGGLHAVALFNTDGTLLDVREDVGRHNALDKLIGHSFRERRLPLADKVLLLSGRASFELMQKAHVAGIRFVAAVGAPSTLAISLARRYELTLIGFLRGERFNVYHGENSLI